LIFDFKLPKNIEDEMKKAVSGGYNFYSPSEGVEELREKIAKKEGSKLENTLVTAGTSEAVNFLFAALVENGTEILLPSPCYPQYPSLVKLWGGTPVFYKCDENWLPDINDIKAKVRSSKTASGNRIKAIVIINPNNPTGAVYDRELIEQISNIAADNDMILISDEIYCDLVFDKKFTKAVAVAKGPVVTLNGMSKCYLAPGWRIGWMNIDNFKDTSLKDAILKLCRLRLCASTPAQYAMAKALENETKHIDKIKVELKARRDFMLKKFEDLRNEGIDINCVKPEGAFYAFPYIMDRENRWKSDLDMVLKIRDNAKVLVVHGSGFNYTSPPDRKYFRIVFLPPEKILNEAITRMGDYIKRI